MGDYPLNDYLSALQRLRYNLSYMQERLWLCTQNLGGIERPHLKDVFKQGINLN